MKEESANDHSSLQFKPIQVKINHPKLNSRLFSFPSHSKCEEVLQKISQSTLLKLFNNYHVEHQGLIVHPKKRIAELALEKSLIQLDIVFQYYNYATAMYHFEIVHNLIKEPFQLSILLSNGKKEETCFTVQPQNFGNQLLPHFFKVAKISIEEIIAPQYQNELWESKTKEQTELLHFLGMSGFHPSTEAQLSGDLFYLHAKTLQNVDLHITASPLGFYLNHSKINNYNPSPLPGRPTYTSLIDLLCNSSERFSITYSKLIDHNERSLIDKIAHREDSILKSIQRSKKSQWLQSNEHEHQWNVRRQSSFKQMDKIASTSYDWNEMFLEIQRRSEQLKKVDKTECKIWEFSSLKKSYNSFQEVAVQGAKKIVEGKLQAMNHSDEKKKHIYVHNRIFFSITQDTPMNHSFDKGDQMIPTGSSSNTDLIQLSELIINRPDSLHLLHTVLVFYRGYRVIAQTILPGLLSSQLSSLTQYGSVDDNKSINNNPEFHKLMIPICKKMHLDDDVLAFDKDDKLVPIAISPEIKGICSSNGEKYLCDLQRLSPRDLNYVGAENEGCVLRQQLLKMFLAQKNPLLPINPNIATSIRYKPSEKTQKQQQQLKKAAFFLQEEAISRLAQTLKSKTGGDHLTDSQGLSTVFHAHGVNMRYLGRVYQHQLLKDAIQVKICLCRNILVRSLKHIFRKALRQGSPLHTSTTMAHLLNCVLARKSQIDQLGTMEQTEERHDIVQPKRKKKKKQKQEQPKNPIGQESKPIKLQNSPYSNIRAQDLWIEIKTIAKARFDHTLEQTIKEFQQTGLFRMPYQKYATLRDLCLCTGLVLQRKNYYLKETDLDENLPFSSKNIIGFTAKSKIPAPVPFPDIEQAVTTADRLFVQNLFPDALKVYQETCQIIRQRGQGSLLSHCLGQISRIHYMSGRLKEAFDIQVGNLALIYKIYREDSFQAVRSYSRLGLYCMGLGVWESALWLLGRGLNLMLLCFGEAYPDVLINFANIARVFQLNRQISQASSCYLKAIEMLNQIHGSKGHINASFCYSSLASLFYQTGQYKKSVEFQGQAVSILMKALPSEDPRNLDAQKILKVYRQFNQAHPRNSAQYRERRK